jgi:hypothetical protein
MGKPLAVVSTVVALGVAPAAQGASIHRSRVQVRHDPLSCLKAAKLEEAEHRGVEGSSDGSEQAGVAAAEASLAPVSRRLTASLADWTSEDVLSLIEGRVKEGQRLEYKGEVELDAMRQRREATKDASGLANAQGGILIYGVEEEQLPDGRRVPTAPKPLSRRSRAGATRGCPRLCGYPAAQHGGSAGHGGRLLPHRPCLSAARSATHG